MDVGEVAAAQISGYLTGYGDGYKAGIEYALATTRKLMKEKGLLPDNEDPKP